MQPSSFNIRPIRPADIGQVAQLIRTVMTEYDCVGEGYSYVDPEVDDMFSYYDNGRSAFFVISALNDDSRILGCGGIAPLTGGAEDTCELRKMYFYTELRGHGMGHRLMEKCLETARQIGYRYCYLETVERMETANYLYQKFGFRRNTTPLGNTGHHVCESYYVREI